jgi:hypothetical protein
VRRIGSKSQLWEDVQGIKGPGSAGFYQLGMRAVSCLEGKGKEPVCLKGHACFKASVVGRVGCHEP